MIGMNDDTRFLTDNRHDQLLAEAETRRLAGGGAERSGIGDAIHRLGSRLFGRHMDETTTAQAVVAVPDSMPVPVAIAADRTRSVPDGCSGSQVHGRIAA